MPFFFLYFLIFDPNDIHDPFLKVPSFCSQIIPAGEKYYIVQICLIIFGSGNGCKQIQQRGIVVNRNLIGRIAAVIIHIHFGCRCIGCHRLRYVIFP